MCWTIWVLPSDNVQTPYGSLFLFLPLLEVGSGLIE
jgi:hypothetical protein